MCFNNCSYLLLRYVLTDETMQEILDIFRDPGNEGLSTRKAAAIDGMPSRTSIRNTLKVILHDELC